MFDIKEDTLNGLKIVSFENQKSSEFLSVMPEIGGIVKELGLSKNNIRNNIIDGPQKDELPYNNWCKSSPLFPFSGIIKDGKYSFERKGYQFEVNEKNLNNSIHGLVYDREFEVVEISATALEA